MSQPKSPRLTAPQIRARKGKEKIVGLTAHRAPMATLHDPFVDLTLAEDSLGMVVHGLPTTVGVTLDMMVLHGCAVMRGSSRALVVVDLPFGSYAGSPQQAHASAVRIMRETSCHAIKLEATGGVAGTIAFLVRLGILVVVMSACVPKLPTSTAASKPRAAQPGRGKTRSPKRGRVDQAGAFAMVAEGVSGELAEEITRSIPTVGIGASPGCDGQILVTDDMIGVFDWTPKFVRRYGKVRDLIAQAVEAYAADVRSGAFPVPAEMCSFVSAPAAQWT